MLSVISISLFTIDSLLLLYTKNVRYFIISLLLSVIFIVAYLQRYDGMLLARRKNLELEFIEVFSYLRIYLSNKENVYRSLKKASEYTSIEMKKEINNFLEKIDNDKTIMPFIKFGNIFHNKVIEEVMISLYQMIDGGFTETYLNQFISLFDNFKNRYLQDDLTNRYKKMDLFTTLSLFGSGFIMMIMLLVVMNIIGGLANGL